MLSPSDPRREPSLKTTATDPTPGEPEDADLPLGCGCVMLVIYAFAAVGVFGLLLIGWRALF